VEPPVDVARFLAAHRDSILERANAEVAGRHLPPYEAAGPEETAERLSRLFDVVVGAASENQLEPALAYADRLAADRQPSGLELGELQRAINSLEEQIWRSAIQEEAPDAQGYLLGVVSTILGAIKDRLACEYVSRAAAKPTRTLRIDELFRGTAAGNG